MCGKAFGPVGVDPAFAVGNKHDITALKTGLLDTRQGRVERFFKISPTAREVFRQLHDFVHCRFMPHTSVEIDTIQGSIRRRETNRPKQAPFASGNFKER